MKGAWSVLVPLIAIQACQTDKILLPGSGSPAGGNLHFDNLASASGQGGLLGILGPFGTFILSMSFLKTVGTLVLL
jgi:hypothetical protein